MFDTTSDVESSLIDLIKVIGLGSCPRGSFLSVTYCTCVLQQNLTVSTNSSQQTKPHSKEDRQDSKP